MNAKYVVCWEALKLHAFFKGIKSFKSEKIEIIKKFFETENSLKINLRLDWKILNKLTVDFTFTKKKDTILWV